MKYPLKHFTNQEEYRFLISEASTLRFPVGHWPESLTVVNEDNGNEAEFFFKKFFKTLDGETGGAIYDNASTWQLKIFND